jgi:hypothetical protein
MAGFWGMRRVAEPKGGTEQRNLRAGGREMKQKPTAEEREREREGMCAKHRRDNTLLSSNGNELDG